MCIDMGEFFIKVIYIIYLFKVFCFFLEKFYGLIDVEMIYCKCYFDLIFNCESFECFVICLKIIFEICCYFD